MKLFENKVGRPSNEILRKRKIFYIIVVLVCICLVAGMIILLHPVKTKKLFGAATTKKATTTTQKITTTKLATDCKSERLLRTRPYVVTFKREFCYETAIQRDKLNKKYNDKKNITNESDIANVVQGSTGLNGIIYFALNMDAVTSVDKIDNYYTKLKTYNINTKKTSNNTGYDTILVDYPTYKINDAVTNTDEKRNYYLAIDANKDTTKRKNSILLYTYNGKQTVRTIKDVKITNIAYNSSNKKYYSIVKVNNKKEIRLYTYTIPKNNSDYISIKNTCEIGYINQTAGQGITMSGYRLYYLYYTLDNGKYTNYLRVYDTRDCEKGRLLTPVYSLNLGTWSKSDIYDNAEPESLFFMNSKLYVAYNNSNGQKNETTKIDKVSFYTLSFTNNINITNIKVKSVNDNKVTLQASATSDNVIYDYKFCTDPKGTGCAYKAIRGKDNYVVRTHALTVTYTIDDNNSDWYFIVRDVLGNTKSVKLSKSAIQAALKK